MSPSSLSSLSSSIKDCSSRGYGNLGKHAKYFRGAISTVPLNERKMHRQMTDVLRNGWESRTKQLIAFYTCRILAEIIRRPISNKTSPPYISEAKNYYYFPILFTYLFTTVRSLFTSVIKQLAMVPCGRKVTLHTLLLILFLMQAVVSQGHKELWGELY